MPWEPSLENEPKPPDYQEVLRWEETRLRARILEERHAKDLYDRQVEQYGLARAKIIGTPDQSVNFLKGLCRQLSVLYMDRGDIAHPDGPYPELLGEDVPDPTGGEDIRRPGFIENAGFWSIMGRVQLWTLGLNEMLVHPCVVDAETNPRLVLRTVEPSCIYALAGYADPTRPVALRYLSKRRDPQTGQKGWCWDEWDIQDPGAPYYRIIAVNGDGTDGDDVTARVLGGAEYASYDQWKKADGTPVIPWVIYHKHWPSGLWDPYDGKAAVEGTMALSIDWAYAEHCFQEAAFPQRWARGCRILPDVVVPQSGNSPATAHVIVDPTRILNFTDDDNAQNPQVGQFQPGADITMLGEYLAARTAQLGQQMGVDASDLVRTSGDPRSGYALAISQEAKRQAQVTYKPQFERSDKELIALCAVLLNRATGSSFPEQDYSIRYADVGAPSALSTSSETDPTAAQPEPAPKAQMPHSPAQMPAESK